jgi:predicted Zn-dependent protease
MRDNELRSAVLALLGGVLIMTAVIGLFLTFVGNGDGDGGPGRPRETILQKLGLAQAGPKCLEPDACRTPTPEFAAAYRDSQACEGTERRICLVPLGEVPKDLVDHLVAYYRDEYRLSLHVLPAVELEPGFRYGRDRQLEAEYLRVMYTDAYPQYVGDRNVLLIGLTSIDIYTPEMPNWRWFFGYLDGNTAVISLFRMDPPNWGQRRDDGLRNKRVRTLMNKYVALGHYKLRLNDDPRSVLFQRIGGLDALDAIDERIPLPR